MGRSKTSIDAIEKARRQEEALKLRVVGYTIRGIAQKMGISKSTAQRYVADAIAEIKREPAQLVIDVELERLDNMFIALMPAAAKGDEKAIATQLKVMERRAKYMGLDQLAALEAGNDKMNAIAAEGSSMIGQLLSGFQAAYDLAKSDDDGMPEDAT